MKRYDVEMRTNYSECWEKDWLPNGYIDADSELEALELAKQYLRECCIDNNENPDAVDEWEFRVEELEVVEW